jgi:predicted metal-dependent hydrolase
MKKINDYTVHHIFVNNQMIMYKLYIRSTKNSYIRLTRDHQVEVIASKYMSADQISIFVKTNIAKIHDWLKNYQSKTLISPELKYISIFSKRYEIKEILATKNNYEVIGNQIYLKLVRPQDKLSVIKKIYTDLTTPQIIKRFAYWKKIIGVTSILKFRWMETKWGVCNSGTHAITLALQLGSNDWKLVDYVIVHELVHIIHPNHSLKFWQHVSKYQPEWKILRDKLNLRD